MKYQIELTTIFNMAFNKIFQPHIINHFQNKL